MNRPNKPKLSCVILSCDPHINKGNCVLHCLYSVLNQELDKFEVILIENSHHKTQNLKLIKQKVGEWNKKRDNPVQFNIIDNKKSFSYGRARNIGVNKANGNLIVFLDDDTIILDKNAFSRIMRLSSRYDYAYGAQRLWTKDNWFQRNSVEILNKIEVKDADIVFKKHIGNPPPLVRNDVHDELLLKTFITNFGFCKKTLFDQIGGYPDFPGYGFEDDFFMFKLFETEAKFILLDDLRVAHISHEVNSKQKNNLVLYFSELIKRGYYWFNVSTIFSKMPYKKEDILVKLLPLHYDPRVENAYKDYLKQIPMDISVNQPIYNSHKKYWQYNNQYERIDFARKLDCLQNSKNLDRFVMNSEADFDNLAAIIKVAIQYGFIEITNKGKIKKLFDFRFTKPNLSDVFETPKLIPDNKLNQFPCDEDSTKKRLSFIKERYPYAEYLSLGIIGDDDFLSFKITDDYWLWPIIIEKDTRIIKTIKSSTSRFKILELDIHKIAQETKMPTVQTFIIDPPYTLHGSLAFILTGLKMLPKTLEIKEFYVILNPTMLGKHLLKIVTILSSCGVFLTEVKTNFSRYKLPENFDEYKRAANFLKQISIETGALEYSSSSNLYIFRTINPEITKLTKQIDFDKLYKHYL